MDRYKVLGLQRSPTEEEIKEAFRKLTMRFHPSRYSQASKAVKDDATLRFNQLCEAYEILIDSGLFLPQDKARFVVVMGGKWMDRGVKKMGK
ncbi:hypothetical protein CDL15_Pgr004974 [Punica granatum]|nr:hypothetical protein CDL15_Pgr004974 [Punica granatum]